MVWASAVAAIMLSLSMEPAARIAPGVLDLPVIDGSRLQDACEFDTEGEPLPPAFQAENICVQFDAQDITLLTRGYTNALLEAGWTQAGGAANAFWFDRADPEGGCGERLSLGAFLKDQANAQAGAVFVFLVEPHPSCASAAD